MSKDDYLNQKNYSEKQSHRDTHTWHLLVFSLEMTSVGQTDGWEH